MLVKWSYQLNVYEIVPEHMMIKNGRGNDLRETNEVKKIYRINIKIREVTEEEQENLSENRRNACEGKTVVTSSIETISEEEYLERSDFAKNFNASSKRVKRYSRLGVCNSLFVGRFTEFKDNNSTVYCSMDREITNSL